MKGVWKENYFYEHLVGPKTTEAVNTTEVLKSHNKDESQ